MPEYDFPSGIQVPGFDVQPWFTGLQIILASTFIAALIVFVWRCFQKVSLWDIAGWTVLVALQWMMVAGVWKFLIFVDDEFQTQNNLMLCLGFTIGLAIVAVNVVALRT